MSEDVLDSIKEQIAENPIILYMKGSPQAPQCGFSAQTVQCMVACGQRFAYVDILSNPEFGRPCRVMPTGQPSRSCG